MFESEKLLNMTHATLFRQAQSIGNFQKFLFKMILLDNLICFLNKIKYFDIYFKMIIFHSQLNIMDL